MRRKKTAVWLLISATLLSCGCSSKNVPCTVRNYEDFSISIPDDWEVITAVNSDFICEGISFFSAHKIDQSEDELAYFSLQYETDNDFNLSDIDDSYGYYWARNITQNGFVDAEYVQTVHRQFGDVEGALIMMNLDYPNGYQDSVIYYLLIPNDEKLYFFIFEVYDTSCLKEVRQMIESVNVYHVI